VLYRIKATKGFTYIEILITLGVMAVLFIPVMQLFSHSLSASTMTEELITATNLAQWQMERIKNLQVTKEKLREMGDSVFPSLNEEPFLMNGARWRIKKEVLQDTDPLEVRVHVYRVTRENLGDSSLLASRDRRDLSFAEFEQENEPLVSLVSLIEDTTWEEIKPAA